MEAQGLITSEVPASQHGKGRKGSACRQIHPMSTIVQASLDSVTEVGLVRTYIRKDDLTEEEAAENLKLLEEAVAVEFPAEIMSDSSYRDKDKELAMKSWVVSVLEDTQAEEETEKGKKKKKEAETEELPFLLQSGIVLCKLATKVVPGCHIAEDELKSGNLMAKRNNISKFLAAAESYGVPTHLLFKPDDCAVLGHVYRVTRTLFALGELTHTDPTYSGPTFDLDRMMKDIQAQGMTRRKSSVQDVTNLQTSSINSIFANLMQDVERRSSLPPRGPPPNIYYSESK